VSLPDEITLNGVRYVRAAAPSTPEPEPDPGPEPAPDPAPTPSPRLSGFRWSDRSERRLEGIHPDLRRVIDRALGMVPIDMTVLEGLRTKSRQRKLVARGSSQTMNSRHLTGHAVDIAPLDEDGQVSWDWPLYHKIAPVIKRAAEIENVAIEWGGDWRSFKDGPHWQLPWNKYPA